MADIAAAAGKDHAVAVRQIQYTDCEIKNPGTRGELIPEQYDIYSAQIAK